MRFQSGVAAVFGLLLFGVALTSSATAESRCPEGAEWTDEVVAAAVGRTPELVAQVRDARSLSNSDLCTMPAGRLERAFWRLANPKPDHPGEWAKFRAMQLAGRDGKVRPDGLIVANQQRRAILEATERKLRAGRAGGISSTLWSAIGPGNIGGRVRAILIHPDNPNRIWVGSVSGGIWTTANGGTSWSPVADFMGNLSITSLIMSPFDTNVIYAATGEGYFNADAVRGAGIFKSVDGGTTWTQLSSTNPLLNQDFYYVNRLAINPFKANEIFAATNGGLYRTSDSGASWEKVLEGRVPDVKINPSATNTVIVGTGPVRYSTDSGTTWNDSNLLGGRAEIAFAKSVNVAYASVDTNSGEIWKSTNNGQTWTKVSNPKHLGSQGWYDNAIWVDPTNANHLLIGGIDLHRSTDGGVLWTKVSLWWDPNSVHADHHAIVSTPGYNGTTNRTVFFGNDGGVYKAADINAVTQTTGWTDLNNGLAITQFYSGAGHDGTNGRIIGGTQDNGSLVYGGTGTNWTEFFGGDGGFSAVDKTDGNYIYGEYVYLKLHRSTDGGKNTAYIDSGIGDSEKNANFIAPFYLDPNNPNTMLAGGLSLWRSTNVKSATPTWTNILPGAGDFTRYISQVVIAEGVSNVAWIGRNDGSLAKSTNVAGTIPTFTEITSPRPGVPVLAILIDKGDVNRVYVGFGEYARNNLWRTTDGGATWTDIGGGLPESPVRAVQRHPLNPLWVYAGTEVGIFTSTDGGTTWGTSNDGPANVSVDQLFWLNSSTLVAATHGRGMFKASTLGAATLTIVKAGGGTGTIESTPAGISCGSVCSANFAVGSTVKLTATPTEGSTFTNWGGGCTGTSPTCFIDMNLASTVTATFAPGARLSLTVEKSGTGTGTVTSSPAGIACGTTCTTTFAQNASVTLAATPTAGSVFSGWGGACSGSAPTCVVAMNAAKTVSATFNGTAGNLLSVTKSGTGVGSVTSTPSGISCGSACAARYPSNATVTLTANPAADARFVGWGGFCSGTKLTCRFTMEKPRNVSATFQPLPILTVSKTGAGTGTVTSVPAGINCGSTCSSTFPANASVKITAVAAAGSTFINWSGFCTGTSPTCTLSMNGNKTAMANFAPAGSGLGDAVDNLSLVWTTGGSASWTRQVKTYVLGKDAAKSGAIEDGQSTYIQTTIVGPGTLSYYWSVSSKASGDKLTFSVNGTAQAGAITGSVGWVKQAWTIPAGTFVLRWTYAKNASGVAGQDAGFLDNVVYSAGKARDDSDAPIIETTPNAPGTAEATEIINARAASE